MRDPLMRPCFSGNKHAAALQGRGGMHSALNAVLCLHNKHCRYLATSRSLGTTSQPANALSSLTHQADRAAHQLSGCIFTNCLIHGSMQSHASKQPRQADSAPRLAYRGSVAKMLEQQLGGDSDALLLLLPHHRAQHVLPLRSCCQVPHCDGPILAATCQHTCSRCTRPSLPEQVPRHQMYCQQKISEILNFWLGQLLSGSDETTKI